MTVTTATIFSTAATGPIMHSALIFEQHTVVDGQITQTIGVEVYDVSPVPGLVISSFLLTPVALQQINVTPTGSYGTALPGSGGTEVARQGTFSTAECDLMRKILKKKTTVDSKHTLWRSIFEQ